MKIIISLAVGIAIGILIAGPIPTQFDTNAQMYQNNTPDWVGEKPREDILKVEKVSEELKTLKSTREATEDGKETPSKASRRRPLRFRKFRAIIEIFSKEPRDDDYVREETKKLTKFANSISETEEIKIIKLQGISIRKEKESAFDINLK